MTTGPVIALSSKSEYRADQRFARIAHELLLNKKCLIVNLPLGKPIMEREKGRHILRIFKIREDTDLARFYLFGRRAEPNKMNLIQNYVKVGKPVLGIRTSLSHALTLKANVPSEGGCY